MVWLVLQAFDVDIVMQAGRHPILAQPHFMDRVSRFLRFKHFAKIVSRPFFSYDSKQARHT